MDFEVYLDCLRSSQLMQWRLLDRTSRLVKTGGLWGAG